MKSDRELISIIIPIYNAANFLSENIKSILTQDYPHFELILIDDGSIDESALIMRDYEEKDSRVICLFQKNSGAPTARNKGLSIAKGTYIQFIDSDDFMEAGALAHMVSKIKETDSDVLIGSYAIVNENAQFMNMISMPFEEGVHRISKKRYGISLLPPMPGNKLYKAKILKENNIIFSKDLKQAQDLNFYLKVLAFAEKVYITEKKLYNYRIRSGSISHTFSLVILDTIKSIEDAEDFYHTINPSNEKLFSNIKFLHYSFQIQKIPQIKDHKSRKIAFDTFKSEFYKIRYENLLNQFRKKKYYIVWLKFKFGRLFISDAYAEYQRKKAKKKGTK